MMRTNASSSSLFSSISGARIRIQSARQRAARTTFLPFPLQLGPRGRAEGTTETLWFADATDDEEGINELIPPDASRLEEGRRVRALAAGALALLLPAALVGMAVAAGTREGESEAIEKRFFERARNQTDG
jgi:hypothetical protein